MNFAGYRIFEVPPVRKHRTKRVLVGWRFEHLIPPGEAIVDNYDMASAGESMR